MKDTEAKPDLPEKKAQLQKMKGLNQDITSHEGAIQSAKDKANELASNAPDSKVVGDTAQICQQYEQLQQNAKVR